MDKNDNDTGHDEKRGKKKKSGVSLQQQEQQKQGEQEEDGDNDEEEAADVEAETRYEDQNQIQLDKLRVILSCSAFVCVTFIVIGELLNEQNLWAVFLIGSTLITINIILTSVYIDSIYPIKQENQNTSVQLQQFQSNANVNSNHNDHLNPSKNPVSILRGQQQLQKQQPAKSKRETHFVHNNQKHLRKEASCSSKSRRTSSRRPRGIPRDAIAINMDNLHGKTHESGNKKSLSSSRSRSRLPSRSRSRSKSRLGTRCVHVAKDDNDDLDDDSKRLSKSRSDARHRKGPYVMPRLAVSLNKHENDETFKNAHHRGQGSKRSNDVNITASRRHRKKTVAHKHDDRDKERRRNASRSRIRRQSFVHMNDASEHEDRSIERLYERVGGAPVSRIIGV